MKIFHKPATAPAREAIDRRGASHNTVTVLENVGRVP
jgi:hypothetical protein